MDIVAQQAIEAIGRVTDQFFQWRSVTNFAYLASALVLFTILWWLRGAGRWGELRRTVFARSAYLHKSALLDYQIFLVNNLVLFWIAASLFFTAPMVADSVAAMLRTAWPALDGTGTTSAGVKVAYTLCVLVASDFALSYGHYLRHKVPLLWEFHKVHHSAQVLNPITAVRRHPVDRLFGGIPQVISVGLVVGLFVYVFGSPPGVYAVMQTPIYMFAWYLLGANLRHTQLWISYGPFWSRVFISPAQHQIHHSRDPMHANKNFGQIFAFWDRLFGSLYVPVTKERLTYGIDAHEDAEFSNLWRTYTIPFRKAARLVMGAIGTPAETR